MKRPLKIAVIILAGLGLALFARGLIEPYMLDQERYVVPIGQLPAEWAGETIAVAGDFQIGMWLDNRNTVQDAVEAIIAANPTAALLLGDFVYHAADARGNEIQEVVRLITPLAEAGIPTYAVLGNHDYGLAKLGVPEKEGLAAAVEAALEEAGIPVLQNESMTLAHPSGGVPLFIVGVGSHYAQNDFPETALAGVPSTAPRVVMMHNPDSFARVPAGGGPLAAAGHTHGGQIRIPFTPEWSLLALLRRGDEVHADGWVESSYGAPGNRLYVNRGIGMSLLPLRIFARPEVTLFQLERAE